MNCSKTDLAHTSTVDLLSKVRVRFSPWLEWGGGGVLGENECVIAEILFFFFNMQQPMVTLPFKWVHYT